MSIIQSKKVCGNFCQKQLPPCHARLQPVTVNNVVNYKVVVQVENKSGLLLPGMTANLEFITEVAKNALTINNAALRFRPNEVMARQIRPLMREKASALPDSIRAVFLTSIENDDAFTNGGFRKALPTKIGGIFYQTGENKVDFEFVNLGITTGLRSEILSVVNGKPFPEGARIIGGIRSKTN